MSMKTSNILESDTSPRLQIVNRGGQFSQYLSNNITFFHYDLKE